MLSLSKHALNFSTKVSTIAKAVASKYPFAYVGIAAKMASASPFAKALGDRSRGKQDNILRQAQDERMGGKHFFMIGSRTLECGWCGAAAQIFC
jgi:hypothetical protein